MQMIQTIDHTILMFIQTNMRGPFLDHIMPIVTIIGNGGFIWGLIAVILLFMPKYRKSGLILLATLLMSTVIVELILKPVFGRLRPCDVNSFVSLLISEPRGFSFPSGHAATSFAAVAVLFSVNKRFGIVAFVFATLIAFSRLYLYVHYPSDVLSGMVFGVICGIFTIWLMKKIYKQGVS